MIARIVGGSPLEPPPPSRFRFMRRAVLLITPLCLLAPASSLASTASQGKKLIQDCASDGEINGKYSQAAYKYALKHIPSDLAEYTNCADAIRQAQASSAGGNHGGGGGGGSAGGGFTGGGGLGAVPGVPPTPSAGGAAVTPAESSAIQAAKGASGAVPIGGGAPVTPGGPGITASSVTRALPTPLLVLLILLGLGGAAGAGRAARTRVLARRQA